MEQIAESRKSMMAKTSATQTTLITRLALLKEQVLDGS
jgi:hypothetical protein